MTMLQKLRYLAVRSYQYQVQTDLINTHYVFVGGVPTDDLSYAYAYFLGGWPNYVGHTGQAPKRAEEHFIDSSIEWRAFVEEARYSAGSSVRVARRLEQRWARVLASKADMDAFRLTSRAYKNIDHDFRTVSPVCGAVLDFWEELGSTTKQWKLLKDYNSWELRVENYTGWLVPPEEYIESCIEHVAEGV